jgi:hypothetical protein
MASAFASTDQIPVDTGGIHSFSVVASDEKGTLAVAKGDPIYISDACALSRDSSGKFFMNALTPLDASSDAAECIGQLGAPKETFEIRVTSGFFAAADVAKTLFVADRAMRFIKAIERHGTKAGQAGTLQIEKCTAGEAAAAGDVLLASAFDLTSDNDTAVEKLGVTTAAATLAEGDAIRLKLASGAATSLADACMTLVFELV